MTYWHGLLTLPTLAAAAILLLLLYWEAEKLWLKFLDGPGVALRLLIPAQQRKAVKFWGKPSGLRINGQEAPPNAYDRRLYIYAFEHMLNGEYKGPSRLMNRLMQWGCYPVLAEAIPRLADDCRRWARVFKQKTEVEKEDREAENKEREASRRATEAQVTALLGDGYESATWIQFGRPHELKPDLDMVLFLPGTEGHEPVPGREHLLLKWPDLAVHIRTTTFPQLAAFCPGGFSHPYDTGINLMERLRAAHPHVFADAVKPEASHAG